MSRSPHTLLDFTRNHAEKLIMDNDYFLSVPWLQQLALSGGCLGFGHPDSRELQ